MDESARKKRQIVFMIIILAIFIFLVMQILVSVVNVYRTNKDNATKIAETSYDCTLLSFYVYQDSIKYNGNTLSFKIQNRIGEPFEELVVDTGSEKHIKELINFISGSEPQTISINDPAVGKIITIYPKTCEQNKKSFEVN